MIAIFKIVQGIVQTIMETAGLGNAVSASLPQELITTIESCVFFESIPLWAVTLIGGIVVTILAYVMILTVYGRFFKLYLYTALSPIPLATFRWRANRTYRKRIFKKLYCCLFRGGNYNSCLYHIFSICKYTTFNRYFSTSSYSSMDVYRRISI